MRISARPFDLQLFAGEKTEPATEKRREEARQKGNVAKSQDLGTVASLLAAFIMLRFYGGDVFGMFASYMRYTLSHTMADSLTLGSTVIIFNQFVVVILKCLAPFLIVTVLASVGANLFQIGFLFRIEPILPDLDRLNPISGLQNIFSWKLVGELVKSILKILVVLYIPFSTMRDQMPFLIRFIQLDPMPAFILLCGILFEMAIKIILVLLVLAVADYYFQVWRYEENLKMSKEEIKEEYKQREGDPKVKAKIRERQRKMATRRMMEEVPKATVVVTNPTHLAIALVYDELSSSAPKVVAKGAGLIARRIKEIAKENKVPTIENKPLARALFDAVEIGDEIPSDLYAAVAEILAQVYRVKGRPATA